MKKTLSLILVLCLLLSASAFAENVLQGTYKKYDDPIVLTTCTNLDATRVFDENNPEKKSIEENRWINNFKEYLNVDLQYLWVTGDSESSQAKWNTAIASNQLPDFAPVDANTYKLLMDSGLVADTTDAWANVIDDNYKANLDDALMNQITFDGRQYGFFRASKAYIDANVLYVRQDWLDKLNLEYPQTLDEIISVAKAFKEAKLGGEDTIGLMVGATTVEGRLAGLMNVFGAYHNYWVMEENGKVGFSHVQPAMREALLGIQSMYSDGIINKDFAVLTSDMAKEYIAGGKTGMFYGIAWITTGAIQALYDLDPEANIVASTIKGINGEPVPFQTNTPSAQRIFVNANCSPEQIEAIAQMLNLSNDLSNSRDAETYANNSLDSDGFMWFKYIPFGDKPACVINDILAAYEIEQAYENGARSAGEVEWQLSDANGWFDAYVDAKNGGATPDWYYLTFGKGGTYTLLYYAYLEGLQLCNAYMGLPTPTQEMMGSIIDDELYTAMLEVIMGKDISVYDAACEAWFANGGQDITDEVNAELGL